MKRFGFASLLGLALAFTSMGCEKPSEKSCRDAIANMRRLMGTDNLSDNNKLEGEVRRCKGGSTKKAVDCAIHAATYDELRNCGFSKLPATLPITPTAGNTGSGAPATGSGSATGSAVGSAGSATDTGSGSAAAAGSGSGSGTGSAAGAGTGSAAGSGTGSAAGVGTGSAAGSGSGSAAGSDAASGSGSAAGSGSASAKH